jgi:xanthine dehydrogenase accessory factor
MLSKFLNTAQSLAKERVPYAMAFVINREIPSSGKPGDKAIIHKDGTISGWIGGGCTRGIVLKEAALSIKDGKPRLVRISPDMSEEQRPGVIHYPMSCHSGGTVELYIEPIMPKPKIVIMGKSHVAMALNRLALAMQYDVTAISRNSDQHIFPEADVHESYEDDLIVKGDYVVVCTQGENDENALLQAAHSGAEYLAFVASRKKANAVFQYLRESGVSMDRLREIRTPAGLDINAKTPEEVAVSILAQIVEEYRKESDEDAPEEVPTAENENIYINPVCGVPVEKATAKHVLEYEGEKVYFCCDGCKVSFEKEPSKYMAEPA